MVNELFEVSKEDHIQKKIMDELNLVFDILLGNTDYVLILDSASVKNEEKLKLIDEAFGKRFHIYILNFLKLLATNRKMHTFFKCVSDYEALYLSNFSAEKITVTTAYEMSGKEKRRLLKTLSEKHGKEFIVTYKIEKSIISGMIIDFKNHRLDLSIRTKLIKMKKNVC